MCYSLAPPPRYLWLLPRTPQSSFTVFCYFPREAASDLQFSIAWFPRLHIPSPFSPWILLPFKLLLVHFIFHDSLLESKCHESRGCSLFRSLIEP